MYSVVTLNYYSMSDGGEGRGKEWREESRQVGRKKKAKDRMTVVVSDEINIF